jgi:hypothetical protein
MGIALKHIRNQFSVEFCFLWIWTFRFYNSRRTAQGRLYDGGINLDASNTSLFLYHRLSRLLLPISVERSSEAVYREL